MRDPENKNKQRKGGEDEIDAQISDKNAKNPNLMDSFKTGDKKQGKYHDKPFDEQMYGGFSEDEEQRGAPEHKQEDGDEDLKNQE